MGILKQAPVTEQLAFETTFLKLLISLINRTRDFEALHEFFLLRDLIYSPGEFGWTAITDAVMRRRFNDSGPAGGVAPGGVL